MRKNVFHALTHMAVLRIDLAALAANYRALKQSYTGKSLAAVVKADAYGVGTEKVVSTLIKEDCNDFFVATLDEGMKLRNQFLETHPDIKIHVLNGLPVHSERLFKEWRLIPVLNTLEHIHVWADMCNRYGEKFPAHIHLDTGLNRLGLSEGDVETLAQNPTILNSFELSHFMTHLACSDHADHPMNFQQRDKFETYLAKLPKAQTSLAASDGMMISPDLHYDLGRAGVALYGISPHDSNLKNVVSFHAQLLQVRDVNAGDTVGYSKRFHADHPTKVGVVACGYADGVMRAAGNNAIFYINEHACPVIGNISMDLTTIDVSNVPQSLLYPGRSVTIYDSLESLSDFAEKSGTIAYEILTNLSKRAHRIYTHD